MIMFQPEDLNRFAIVLMKKDPSSGLLDSELDIYMITENERYIVSAFAEEREGLMVFLKLSCDPESELSDEMFDDVYDSYEFTRFEAMGVSVTEETDCYDPTWIFSFPYSENRVEMEDLIEKIIKNHILELSEVFKLLSEE